MNLEQLMLRIYDLEDELSTKPIQLSKEIKNEGGPNSLRYWNMRFRECATHTPLMLDIDNIKGEDNDLFFGYILDLNNYLGRLGIQAYFWKTSSHKENPGYHIISKEYITWEESDIILKKVLNKFPNLVDAIYVDLAMGKETRLTTKTETGCKTKRVSVKESAGRRHHTCRISQKYKGIEDIVPLHKVDENLPPHVLLRNLYVQLYNMRAKKENTND